MSILLLLALIFVILNAVGKLPCWPAVLVVILMLAGSNLGYLK